MLLTAQSFGVQSPGGGPRILRALLQDPPEPVISVSMEVNPPPATSHIQEFHLPPRHRFGRLESTRFRPLLDAWLCNYTKQQSRLEALCKKYHVEKIHTIAHGPDFWAAHQTAQKLQLPLFLTVHDRLETSLASSKQLPLWLDRLGEVWRHATARMVISPEMGESLDNLYEKQPWTVVTDGLDRIHPPRQRPTNSLRIYFAGALHLTYKHTMAALAQALHHIQQNHPNMNISFTVRGSAVPACFEGLPTRSLSWAPESELEQDMEEADLLYLPLPFSRETELFWRYSLSTKLVTYLGSGLPILYHGPAEAAAGLLLAKHEAAIMITSLEPENIVNTLLSRMQCAPQIVENAQKLAQEQFLLKEQRRRFWGIVCSEKLPQ